MIINPFVFGGGGGPPVFWTNLLGVATFPDAYHPDGKIVKNTGDDLDDNCSAFSIDSFDVSTGGILRWDVVIDWWCAVGLNKVDVAGVWQSIAFAFASNAGDVSVCQTGSFSANKATSANQGLTREIRILPSGEVSYWLGGDTLYISLINAGSGVYHAAATIHTNGHLVERVRVLPIPANSFWWYGQGIGFSAGAVYSDGTLTRTRAGNDWFNAGSRSRQSFVRADNRKLTWTRTASITADGVIVGIDDRTYGLNASRQGYDMPFSFIVQGVGNLLVWENSAQKFASTCVAGDALEIRVSTTGAVTYWKNGALLYTSLTAVAAGVPYWVSTAIFNNGSTIDGVDLV